MGAEHEMGESMAALHMAMDPGKKGEMRFTPMEPGEYESRTRNREQIRALHR